jgi:hypothetical protein
MNIRRSGITKLIAVVTIVGTSWGAAAEGPRASGAAKPARVFKAGAAASNITPPLDEPIVGGWDSPPAKHIHDELYARCLVLDDGKTKLAFVLVDSVGMAREVFDAAKKVLREKTGIPAANMMMAATHTHSSISARGLGRMRPNETLDDYQKFVVQRIADGVRRAVNNLEPARIGWGRAEEPTQVFNRRYFMKPGTPTPNPFGGTDQAVMNPGRGSPNLLKAAGPTDPEIAFVSVQSQSGRPIALLANYSLHYVGPSAGPVISADYFAVFADRIQELLGADRLDPPFIGIMSNGTSGDINNINWLSKSDERWLPYAKMRQVADLVAQAVHRAHQEIVFRDWVPLAARQQELVLAVRKPTEEQLAYARKVLAKPQDAPKHHQREQVYADRTLELAEAPDRAPVILQAFGIGDLGICTIPFEAFVEIGLELKERSPFGRTFTVSHANGSYGYLPTAKQHELGGYETWQGSNNVEIQAAAKIVDRLLAMLQEIHSDVRVN